MVEEAVYAMEEERAAAAAAHEQVPIYPPAGLIAEQSLYFFLQAIFGLK